MAADFSDEFTEAFDTLLKNHTPDVGTSWSWVGTNDDGAVVDAADDALNLGSGLLGLGSSGVGYSPISPEPSSADQQVWGQQHAFNANTNSYMSVRLVDENNLYGYRLAGSGSAGRRLSRIVTSTVTDLITSQGVSGEWIRVKAEGTTITFWQGGTGAEPTNPEEDTNWTQIGTDQTGQTDHQTEKTCGLAFRAAGGSTEWLTSFRASSLAAAGGAVGRGLTHSLKLGRPSLVG